MYLAHYNLAEKPFQITTDSRFLWLGEKHKEAFATLQYGILDNKGFLLLTGDVGTGKTTLINALVRGLGPDIVLARIPDPRLSEMDFFRYLANAFKISGPFQSKGNFLYLFGQFLEKAHAGGKRVVLVIDEAQRLRPGLLEEIRHLSNIEKEDVKLLNIFFVGQVEFNNVLLLKKNRAIRQRITINYTLKPLTGEETGEYIKHRLKVAGGTGEIFTPEAVKGIYAFSRGAPRLINIICDRALLTGFVENANRIDGRIVGECARELEISPVDLDDDSDQEEDGTDVSPGGRNETETGPNENKGPGREGNTSRGIGFDRRPANGNGARPPARRDPVELSIPNIQQKRSGMWGIYLIYILLIISIVGIGGYLFFSPELKEYIETAVSLFKE